jgi:hypothetical protein
VSEQMAPTSENPPLPCPEQMLLEALARLAPEDLLEVGASDAVARYRALDDRCRVTRADPGIIAAAELDVRSQRFAVAVLSAPESYDDASALRLIAALRDRYCRAIFAAAPEDHWPFSDWLALGFELAASCEHAGIAWHLYTFDADRANPEREWNNPTDWAHPENFDRFRW